MARRQQVVTLKITYDDNDESLKFLGPKAPPADWDWAVLLEEEDVQVINAGAVTDVE